MTKYLYEQNTEKEKTIIVGVDTSTSSVPYDIDFSLNELSRLVDTAGGNVIERFTQKLETVHPGHFIGSGKLDEIKKYIAEHDVDAVIFDDKLSPAQQRNIESILEVKVIDRTRLILDIFAKHARTKESKLQIELAQLQYLLPRLTGKGVSLSQQKGGIGTRGPGETKLETDTRKIKTKIDIIKDELEAVKRTRENKRSKRDKNDIPLVAIAGYTNAGKSTLLKTLTQKEIFAEDKLFATLDTQIKRFSLPDGQDILFLDTVGFVQKLPHELVAAFRSTLEEITSADIIIHLIDISIENFELQKKAVYDVLAEIDIKNIPVIEVYNKADVCNEKLAADIAADAKTPVISCKNRTGFSELFAAIERILNKMRTDCVLNIPYADSKILDQLYKNAAVQSVDYESDFIIVHAQLNTEQKNRLEQYILQTDVSNDQLPA